MVGEALGDGVVPLIISIARHHMALRGHSVAIPAPLCQEGSVVSVVWVEWYLVVTIPCVHHALLGVGWNLGCQLEGALDGEGLAERMSVKWLVIDSSTRRTISFGSDNHPGEPGHWAVVRDLLQDP